MKLKIVTQSISLLIIVFTVIAIIIGAWGWQQMERPYKINQDFHHFQNTINTDIYIKLEQYLGSGDATLLQQAENALDILSSRPLDWLSEEENRHIQEAILNVRNNVFQVRESGKLAANPEELLINNERDRSGDVSVLLKYTEQSTVSLQVKAQYLKYLADLNASLQKIALLRQRYVLTNDDSLKQDLLLENMRLSDFLEQISRLPELGVMSKPDPDDFDNEPVDLGQESFDSLSSLTRRYPKELSNTAMMRDKILQSRKSLKASLNQLKSSFEQYADHVDVIKENITLQVSTWVLISVSLIVFLLAISFILQTMTLSFLSQLVPFISGMAQGRFDRDIKSSARFYEIETVMQTGILLQKYLEDMINQLQKQSGRVLDSGQEMQLVSEQAFRLVNLQNQKTEAVAVSINQLSNSFAEVARNAANASESAQNANEAVKCANEKLDVATHKIRQFSSDVLSLGDLMHQLDQDSDAIESVLDVIKGVAEQTNLLALNAAIEAARAGEQGRGFAVVADEVRKLAQRTAHSTGEIQTIIVNLANTAKSAATAVEIQSNAAIDCVNQTQEAQNALKPVVTAVLTISDYNAGIASATEQQSVTAEEVARSTGEIQQHANEVSQDMRHVQAASEGLNHVSESLNQLVRKLKAGS